MKNGLKNCAECMECFEASLFDTKIRDQEVKSMSAEELQEYMIKQQAKYQRICLGRDEK